LRNVFQVADATQVVSQYPVELNPPDTDYILMTDLPIYETIALSRRERLLTITLNLPDSMNACNPVSYTHLTLPTIYSV